MFRKPNRNVRVRRAVSSEEEVEEERNYGRVERPKRAGGRGLTCGTRKRREAAAEDSDEEDAGGADPDPPRTAAPHSALSFTEEKEGNDGSFKIRKPTVSAVVFTAQKKTEDGGERKKPPDKEEDGSSESEDNEPEDVEVSEKEEYSSPASGSPMSSPSHHPAADDIPDGRQIRAARTQRRLARTQGDYISLDVSHERSDSSQSEGDSELDDHEKRIKFAPGVKTIKERMAEEMSSSSGAASDDEEIDNIQNKWEGQQMRKAIRCLQTVDSPPRVKKYVEPKFSTPPVTVEDIRKRLAARIASIEEVHRAHVLESEKYTRDLEDAKNTLGKLETSSGEKSYKFFKEMKVFVENFVDCLNEKIQEISQSEAEMSQILEGHSKDLLKRRQEELQLESNTIQKFAGTGDVNAMEADEETKRRLQDVELRRRRRRQKRDDSGQKDHREGMSSDDELPPEQEREYKQNREDVLFLCKPLFEDVHEDFCQIKNILGKFHEWRERFPETYHNAYISLCIPKLLRPLVRAQLIGWNPLEDSTQLEQMSWYRDLDDFCFSKTDHENMEDDPDHKVLTAVIEKTVIPKVIGLVENVWDPMSSVQTGRLVHFCKTHVLGDEKNASVQGLVTCLVSRLKKSIEDDVFIPLYPKRLLEDRSSAHSTFQERQFWSAVKLFGNILLWDGFLQEEILQELSLDKMLNRYLILVLLNSEPDSELVNKCHKIVECLPQSWFRGLGSGATLTRLGNFSKHLANCVHALHKLNDRKGMEVLVSLLIKIKAQNLAEEVAAQYGMEGHVITA
ncbi:intron Large complex component GCFC2 [Hyla sarda]|uniref:intron Large complex component GCFC2 n=1 Tax=Hyla sarda TaxID=327740 RepID=UPI0024C2ABC9|nr:intron Large complex component GCFC2 [Hyla sarda]